MDVNFLSVVVAALSTFVMGFIWYNPKIFGTAWMKSIGMTEEKAQQGNMPMIFGLSLVMSFLTAFFLYVWINLGGASEGHGTPEFQTFKHGAFHGMFLGILVAMPVLVTNALYEQKSFTNMAINVGYWIVTFAIMGGIVGVWH